MGAELIRIHTALKRGYRILKNVIHTVQCNNTVNSDIFARVLFSGNVAAAIFCENKILTK